MKIGWWESLYFSARAVYMRFEDAACDSMFNKIPRVSLPCSSSKRLLDGMYGKRDFGDSSAGQEDGVVSLQMTQCNLPQDSEQRESHDIVSSVIGHILTMLAECHVVFASCDADRASDFTQCP